MDTAKKSIPGKSMWISEGIIFVRDYSGTHIARWRGKTASCTAGRKAAAEALAKKIILDRPYFLQKCGNEYAWQVLVLNRKSPASSGSA